MEFTEVTRVWEQLQKEQTLSMECRLLSISGEYRWAELILTRINEFDTTSDTYDTAVYMVRDIHARKSKELEILQKNQDLIVQLEKNNSMLFEQGMIDELTKLYNRKGLVWFGRGLIEEAKEKDQYIYTMVADLNGLKYINDKFGHEEGDKAIRAITGMLRDVMPEYALVSRTGGDEFTVMAMLEKDSQLPKELEQKLLKTMKDFNVDSGLSYMVEASYGWDFRPASGIINMDDCVKRADNKMYDMKTKRRMSNRFSGKASEEINRRFGSAKQSVFILSADKEVQESVSELFDLNYLLCPLETADEALRRLEDCDESTLLFVDNQLDGQSGVQFIKSLTEKQRQNVIPVLLLEREDADMIAEAFEAAIDDVLIKPYNTILNKCRMKLLSQMNITNRKLSQILEQQATL